jgi:hypothetical protein
MYSVALLVPLLYLLVQPVPVELTPVDAGVEDVNSLSQSLRLEPFDMRVNQSFEQLFRVEGSPEIYVRSAGSLHAVFRDPHYLETMGGAIPLVPTGTIYCIGEVTQEVLRQLGVIASGENTSENEYVSDQNGSTWNPAPPAVSSAQVRTIRFLDDGQYRRRRLASFVLEISFEK